MHQNAGAAPNAGGCFYFSMRVPMIFGIQENFESEERPTQLAWLPEGNAPKIKYFEPASSMASFAAQNPPFPPSSE
jgi:hypothetical protein